MSSLLKQRFELVSLRFYSFVATCHGVGDIADCCFITWSALLSMARKAGRHLHELCSIDSSSTEEPSLSDLGKLSSPEKPNILETFSVCYLRFL